MKRVVKWVCDACGKKHGHGYVGTKRSHKGTCCVCEAERLPVSPGSEYGVYLVDVKRGEQ